MSSQPDEQLPERRINVGLPVSTHARVAKLAERTHRTLVGVITYMTEQMEREEGIAPASADSDSDKQPQVQPA